MEVGAHTIAQFATPVCRWWFTIVFRSPWYQVSMIFVNTELEFRRMLLVLVCAVPFVVVAITWVAESAIHASRGVSFNTTKPTHQLASSEL